MPRADFANGVSRFAQKADAVGNLEFTHQALARNLLKGRPTARPERPSDGHYDPSGEPTPLDRPAAHRGSAEARDAKFEKCRAEGVVRRFLFRPFAPERRPLPPHFFGRLRMRKTPGEDSPAGLKARAVMVRAYPPRVRSRLLPTSAFKMGRKSGTPDLRRRGEHGATYANRGDRASRPAWRATPGCATQQANHHRGNRPCP